MVKRAYNDFFNALLAQQVIGQGGLVDETNSANDLTTAITGALL